MNIFLKAVIGMNQEKLLISRRKQYLHDAIISIDRQKQPPYTSIHRKQYLIKTRFFIFLAVDQGLCGLCG